MMAYVLIFNNLYLRQFGATAAQLSLLNGLLVLPFILKIGLGLLSDKFPLGYAQNWFWLGQGHRIPYIVIGLLLITAVGIIIAYIPPVQMYPLYVAMALLIALGVALYDTVADGFAIDVTPDQEQGTIQGVMVVGRAMGLVAFATLYGRIIVAYGWSLVFFFVAVLALLPLPFLWQTHEPTQRAAGQTFSWAALRTLWQRDIACFSLYAIIYSMAAYGANAIITLFANEELGGTLVQVGDVAALGGIGMIVGGGLGIVAGQWLGMWAQAMWTNVAVSAILLLLALTATLQNIAFIIVAWGTALAAAELIYITLAMAKADRRMGAGQFALFMAFSNVGTGIGQATSTGLIDLVDFRWIFATLAALNLLTLPLLWGMRQEKVADVASLLFRRRNT